MPRQQTVVVLLLPAPELKQRHDKRGRERWTGSDKEVVGYPTCLVSAACLCELRRDGPCPLGGDAPKNRANNFGPGSRLVAFRARGAHRAGGPRQLRAFPRAPTKKLIAISIFPNNPPDGGGPDGLPSLQWLHQWHARSAGGACSGPLFFLFSNEAPPQHVDAPSAKAQELRKKARANAAPNWLLCPEAPPHRRRRAASRRPRCQADTQYSPPHPLAHRVGGGGCGPSAAQNEPPGAQRCGPPLPRPRTPPSPSCAARLLGLAVWMGARCGLLYSARRKWRQRAALAPIAEHDALARGRVPHQVGAYPPPLLLRWLHGLPGALGQRVTRAASRALPRARRAASPCSLPSSFPSPLGRSSGHLRFTVQLGTRFLWSFD